MGLPPKMVGNDFRLGPPARPLIAHTDPGSSGMALPVIPILPTIELSQPAIIPISLAKTARRRNPLRQLFELAHHQSIAVFALLFLLVGVTGIGVGGNYWSARILSEAKPAAGLTVAPPTIAGLNLTVPASQLQAKLQAITDQAASITVGSQAVTISPDTIKSWLQITLSADKSKDYLRVNTKAMTDSLQAIADQFLKAPVNQVTATYADGTSDVIMAGSNGVALSDPNGLAQQAANVSRVLMDGGGLQFTAPTISQGFASVTPANFNKLLEVNVNTHIMYAYQNGQLVNTFLITAGAPETPTPIGEFHIWEKLPLQTMTGFNPNGTKYVQPNVPWINYFDHSGDAVHGNYWRPASVFGNVNTSHGCVGLPVNEAEWVYDWAPIGTTVITHA